MLTLKRYGITRLFSAISGFYSKVKDAIFSLCLSLLDTRIGVNSEEKNSMGVLDAGRSDFLSCTAKRLMKQFMHYISELQHFFSNILILSQKD